MKGKKTLFLFLALLLPIFVFLFLKMFGRNEFVVKPLYHNVMPEVSAGCSRPISLPYHIPDTLSKQFNFAGDSLMIIWFTDVTKDTKRFFDKVSNNYEAVSQLTLTPSIQKNMYRKKCIFFLKDNYDIVLLDKQGVIRGQYASMSREEIDRLFIELDIILKKY